MRRRVIAKGNVRRGDLMRVVLTDTLPEEVPIIFSNDGFYLNTANPIIQNVEVTEFVSALLRPERSYTKPYRYSVLRDAFSARGLSLIHPSAQQAVAKFYHQYDSLITHYAGKSVASLRSPHKVGGTFFIKGPVSEKNQFKSAGIDTVSLETTVSNPASYFSYNRISRAHEFFNSNEYFHLEKKFSFFRTLDVSKCFNSIYTHTLFWATADIQTAKDNTSAKGFANEFDHLMQSMNFNETNGICIGPEVSRVFAELIFSEIDKRVITLLESKKLKFQSQYEFRRYLDDFYVFAQDVSTADKVTAAIQVCLAEFNLHLNTEKTVTICRPFSTKKSEIISAINHALSEFFARLIAYVSIEGEAVAVPRRIVRSDALMRSFVKSVKSTCSLHNTGYETVSDYIVSALSKRIAELSDDYVAGIKSGEVAHEHYIAAVLLLVEITYFFYTVNPTVRASLNVARAAIVATRFTRERYPERLPFLSESIVRWILDLARSIERGEKHRDLTAVPIEVLNVLLPMSEVAEAEPLIDDLIDSMCHDIQGFEYFEIVSFIFLAGGRARHRETTARLFARGKAIIDSSAGPRVDSQAAHLCIDLLTCGLVTVLRRSLESLKLVQGDRRDDQAYRRVQAGGGAYRADEQVAA